MPQILIIGYGNPLRGDDAAGWIVAERLRENLAPVDPVQIVTVHQLMPELAEPISQADLVIFIDAASQGDSPGAWKCQAADSRATVSPSNFGHHVTPAELLAYARCVFQACPRALVVSIAAESFELGAPLSAPVRRAANEVTRHLIEKIHPFGTTLEISKIDSPGRR